MKGEGKVMDGDKVRETPIYNYSHNIYCMWYLDVCETWIHYSFMLNHKGTCITISKIVLKPCYEKFKKLIFGQQHTLAPLILLLILKAIGPTIDVRK